MKSFLLSAFGLICVALGVAGIFLPLLPTTPFLLLAAACFVRSSPRLDAWLMSHRIFGSYIRNYRDHGAISRGSRNLTLAFLWLTLGLSAAFAATGLHLHIFLLLVGVCVTWHLMRLKVLPCTGLETGGGEPSTGIPPAESDVLPEFDGVPEDDGVAEVDRIFKLDGAGEADETACFMTGSNSCLRVFILFFCTVSILSPRAPFPCRAWGVSASRLPRNGVAEDFLSPAARGEVAKTIVDAYEYEISRLRGSMTREATLAGIDAGLIGDTGALFDGNPEWADILDSMEEAFSASMEGLTADCGDRHPGTVVSQGRNEARYRALAFGRAREYLGLDGRRLMEPAMVKDPAWSAISDRPSILSGYPPETASVDTVAVEWNGRDEYVKTRLGPLAGILLDPNLEAVCFSNLPATEAAALVDMSAANKRQGPENERYGRVWLLALPVSSYGKQIAVRRAGKRFQVFLADFPGKVYLRHFQLLVKDFMEKHGLNPKIMLAEDQSVYEWNYRRLGTGLAELLAGNGRIQAVVVGYASHFKRPWRRMFVKSLSAGGSSNPWRADLYRIDGDALAAVIESSEPWHGEILGKALAEAAGRMPDLRAVFAGGSAGSLQVGRQYSLVFPDLLVLPGGGVAVNALSPGGSMVSHFTVISPMAETPDFLEDLMKRQVATVDMEMGHLAENLAPHGIRTGVALLATDFPVKRPIDSATSLHDQKAGEKYRDIGEYPDAVLACLTKGEPAFRHPVEGHLKTSLRSLSRRNLAREMAELGPLSLAEQGIFDKIRALPIGFSSRLTPWRLLRVLQDGALLSTARVRDLKNIAVKPYTPQIEEDLYGAFDYIFGTVGLWKGSKEYGGVILEISPRAWKRRSFATRRSGWRAIEQAREEAGLPQGADDLEPQIASRARRIFGEMVFLPIAYGEAMAVRAIQWLRENPSRVRDFVSAKGETLERLVLECRLGYLEGKIMGSMNLSDIEEAVLPADLEPDLAAEIETLARKNGIKVSRAEDPPK